MKVAAAFCFAVGGWVIGTLVFSAFVQAAPHSPAWNYLQSVQAVTPWSALLTVGILIIVGGFHLLDLNDKRKDLK